MYIMYMYLVTNTHYYDLNIDVVTLFQHYNALFAVHQLGNTFYCISCLYIFIHIDKNLVVTDNNRLLKIFV